MSITNNDTWLFRQNNYPYPPIKFNRSYYESKLAERRIVSDEFMTSAIANINAITRFSFELRMALATIAIERGIPVTDEVFNTVARITLGLEP